MSSMERIKLGIAITGSPDEMALALRRGFEYNDCSVTFVRSTEVAQLDHMIDVLLFYGPMQPITPWMVALGRSDSRCPIFLWCTEQMPRPQAAPVVDQLIALCKEYYER